MSDPWTNETLTEKLKGLCGEVKKLRPFVYGAVALFSILVGLGLALRADIQYATASTSTIREKHVKEYRDMELSIRKEIKTLEDNMNRAFFDVVKDLGRNEAYHIEIASKLDNIDKKLDEMTVWMREHK
jgi:hypothetical protein